ncbi:putative membrane protein [Mycobacterium antarcticum]|uniref:DUF4350 domain-containing protein n=1 Tax=unclassified Mycolicibacterium TaxID=2636767 RepID=UPI002388B0A3|nr:MULTISPECIES: DUF4350 domain-containing protein [unclassified Mycolicibacterium]GLP73382.1 putative membrane protein [Mycolicibacterium sp. TUM20983]GLP79097.1 putative membrane protein [Mycolicibacterium sp. TUM20984]
MTDTSSAVGSTVVQRWRALRWVLLALVVVVGVSVLSTYLTAPRPGGRMDPEATSPDGAHALVTLLAERGVEVVPTDDLAGVARAAQPDSLLLVAPTPYLLDDDGLQRLRDLPGDVLLVEPISRTRESLAPRVRLAEKTSFGGQPDCDMREATRAGSVQLDLSDTYEAAADGTGLTSCYGGALVRYADRGRTVTVVGTANFMTNSGLVREGNAALAMNLAGVHPRVIWYTPKRIVGESDGATSIMDLIPARVGWVVLQLCLAVGFVALWRGRRIGPLVAEQLPVVVRASETVEGRGRLYRSRRARDRAASALRTATLHRLAPRLGLGVQTDPASVVAAVAERIRYAPDALGYALFGPAPTDDAELVELSRLLDDIERQVIDS